MVPVRFVALLSLAIMALCGQAEAGMPSPPTLTEMAQMRIEVVSFFLLVFLLVAFGIKVLWNYLRKDFPRMPVLTYKRALALVLLWALAFFVVLVMISGARELMTPGAWERDGGLYKLTGTPGHKGGTK